MRINLPFGAVRRQGPDPRFSTADFRRIHGRIDEAAHQPDWEDENDIEISPWALKKLGPLAPGEICGFTPVYSILPHHYPAKNLSKQPVIEHLVMLAMLSPPTLYDYIQPEDGEGGFDTLTPIRPVGPQS